MNYSTVIFDLDGTILDTSKGIMSCVSYTANKMGASQLTIAQQKSFIGPPLIDSFIRECGFTYNKAREAVALYRKRYKEKGLYEAKHYNQMKELLILLKKKKYTIAVATLKRDDLACEIIKHFGLLEFFDSIKGIDYKDKLSKADIISMCLGEIGQDDLSKTVMIGDSVYDAIGAKEIGIDFIAVTYGYGFKSKESAEEVDNIFVAENIGEIIDKFL